jgi:hypothetical protein
MHPTDPETLLVATWERRRDEFDSYFGTRPDGIEVYGPIKPWGNGSGLHKTTDGGNTFKKITKGLPTVKLGRMGLDYSRKNPNTLFAIVDSENSGKGTPPATVFMGFLGEDAKEGGSKMTRVTPDRPAAKAGLMVDDVITSFDGKEVKNYNGLLALLREKKPGDKVKVVYLRGKEKKETEVTLEPRPELAKQRPSLGIRGEPAETTGIRITEVIEGGTASKGGLKVEDVITSLNDTPIADTSSIFTALRDSKIGDKVKIRVNRGKEKLDLTLTLQAPAVGNVNRPYLTSPSGQQANMQDQQGPDGSQTGGVYKSTDNGESWTRVNSYNPRPFYFSRVRVDPTDDKIIYILGVDLYRSLDGGATFLNRESRKTDDGRTIEVGIDRGVHSDQHAMWINPKDSRHIIVGTDGGFYITYDKCDNWEHLNNFALGQFYHVAVDNRRPYRVYGGLQDNGSWGGPSNSLKSRGPINDDWIFVNSGDGFVCRVDPNDPDLVYAESQDGRMNRRNFRTGQSFGISPRQAPNTSPYRFNWNTPFILSSHNPSIF